MPASQPANFNLQEFSDLGQLLVGGRLYTYAYGTTASKIAYTNPEGTAPHGYTPDGAGGEYIALNARGELPAPLYLGSGSYDLTLRRADGSTVWTRKADGVDNAVNALSAALAGASGIALVGGAAQVAPSIAVLRTLKKNNPSKHVLVTGYYAQGDGGGGTYFLDSADNATADNGGTVIVAVDGGRWKLQRGAFVSPRHFGAKGDGNTIDTLALNAWTAYMMGGNAAANQHACYGACGTYVVDGAGWHIPVGDYMPNLFTDGADQFCIKGEIATLVTIEATGGSGQLPTVEWQGIKLDGVVQGANVGVCVKGVCFFTGKGWHFYNLGKAIRYLNEKAGSFTEGVVFEDAYFHTSVTTWLQYSKTAGDGSFRSSGLRNFKGNLGPTAGPAILIDSGCVPYMGPLSGIIWAYNPNSIFIRNNSTQVPFIGDLDTETQQSGANKLTLADNAGSGYVFLHGSILAWNFASGNISKGKLLTCREYLSTNDGLGQLYQPTNTSGSIVSTQVGQTFSIPYMAGVHRPMLQDGGILTVSVTAPNGYYWRGMFAVMSGQTDNIVNAAVLPGAGIVNNADLIGEMVSAQGTDYDVRLTNGNTPVGTRCTWTMQYTHGLLPQ